MQKSICDRVLMEKSILLCITWGQHQVPSVHRECCVCHCDLALANSSVGVERELNLKPICLRCCITVAAMSPEDTAFGGVIYDGLVIKP